MFYFYPSRPELIKWWRATRVLQIGITGNVYCLSWPKLVTRKIWQRINQRRQILYMLYWIKYNFKLTLIFRMTVLNRRTSLFGTDCGWSWLPVCACDACALSFTAIFCIKITTISVTLLKSALLIPLLSSTGMIPDNSKLNNVSVHSPSTDGVFSMLSKSIPTYTFQEKINLLSTLSVYLKHLTVLLERRVHKNLTARLHRWNNVLEQKSYQIQTQSHSLDQTIWMWWIDVHFVLEIINNRKYIAFSIFRAKSKTNGYNGYNSIRM